MKRLSQSAARIEGQPMFKVLGHIKELERAGRDIVHFEIGDPDFGTPPNIVEAACASLRAGYVRLCYATSSNNIRKGLARMKDYLVNRRNA